MPNFVHLHTHSDFSLLHATTRIKDMVARAAELNMPALAMTDLGNMFGVIHFYTACRKAGIKPIVGTEVYIAPNGRLTKEKFEDGNRLSRLVLLARNLEGYQNLLKISTIGYTEGFYYKPRIDDEVLEQHSQGLICLTGPLSGEVPNLIVRNRVDEAQARLEWYIRVFGQEHVFVCLQDHNIPDEKIVNRTLIELAPRLGLPLIATNDVHYLNREDAVAQDALLCIGSQRKRNETNRHRFHGDQYYFKTAEEMAQLFPEQPEALENTLKVAGLCELEIPQPGPLLPDYHIPPDFETPDDYLRHLTYEGLRSRYGEITEEIDARADYELGIIISMGFTGYFLIVWDFIRYAHDNDIPVGPGRGSGAGSIVAYALAITDIDPLKYSLLFERFLNPERVSMPDFDIDFCFERRQEVINYVTSKYGHDRVGQIITFGTLKAKAVIRDVARVLDLPYTEADMIAKLIPDDLKMTLPKALEVEPKLQELRERGGTHQDLIEIGLRLEGLHRHASTHAAGVVIGKEVLTEYVPLYRDPKTAAISTQFTMDLLEPCGLVKMDFLGLKTLTLIRNTEKLIRERGIAFDIEQVSEEDPATFTLLGEGRSICVFQFESDGMQDILKKAKPSRIEDLIALNALYRPGPMDNIPQFIESKWNPASITYPHPDLEQVLKETYGVIVYQEQVMEIVQIIGGFSLGQADILRRAMGKKKEQEMARMEVEYLQGAREKGIAEDTAKSIFELLKPFAGYGFNKSHAAAYSVLAYKTAYLKANYPAEFMAANLTNEINNPKNMVKYMAEAHDMGLEILPPDINTSKKHFSVVDGRIIYGLVGIKNVGSSAVDAILHEREANGPFSSMDEFLERIDMRTVNRKVIEVLIVTGVFDCFGRGRRPLLEFLGQLADIAAQKRKNREEGQVSLFADSEEEEFPELDFAGVQEFPLRELLQHEKEILGFYFSGHPLDDYRETWLRTSTCNLARMETLPGEKEVTLLGLVTSLRVIFTKRGSQMAIGTIEDYNGSIDFVMFAEALEPYRDLLQEDAILGVLGKIDTSRDRVQIVASEIRLPDELDERDIGVVHIRLRQDGTSEKQLHELRAFLSNDEHTGCCPVFLHIPRDPKPEVIIEVSAEFRTSSRPEVLQSLRTFPAVERVWREIEAPKPQEASPALT
ncbi:DNA polymerase III subunit alpha [Spirochaeta africana]|uniref:DNA polymerase III subunit alpha n=1 Tax=Spirochaeta africana (strain ATCC 700263 / DSM 8902 / Z-7692) TaxID=889378 RepID=H9UL68_SPIAZ|nr:DNA polymerase III subunit alpha [Spirochaeta africana]AFG38261.1 DNA-directed DNA polymerase III PolC [Spirochaeta africana DSM 8902]